MNSVTETITTEITVRVEYDGNDFSEIMSRITKLLFETRENLDVVKGHVIKKHEMIENKRHVI